LPAGGVGHQKKLMILYFENIKNRLIGLSRVRLINKEQQLACLHKVDMFLEKSALF